MVLDGRRTRRPASCWRCASSSASPVGPDCAGLLRGETLKLRELEYIQAAQAFGVSNWRIIVRHILPNLMHIVIIALVMDFPVWCWPRRAVPCRHRRRSEHDQLRHHDQQRPHGAGREPVVWWSLAAAFAAMFILVLAANLFADAVRDAF